MNAVQSLAYDSPTGYVPPLSALRRLGDSLRRPSAFTLVELLVVIGIIAVLISILLPSLAKARQSALTVACASNMRQTGLAIIMYTNENQGWLPAAKLNGSPSFWVAVGMGTWRETWAHKLVNGKYIPPGPAPDVQNICKSPILQCPAGPRGFFSYAPSLELFGFEPVPGVTDEGYRFSVKKLVRLTPSANYILLAETPGSSQRYPGFGTYPSFMSDNNFFWAVPHNKFTTLNILCADGHVQQATYRLRLNDVKPPGYNTYLTMSAFDYDTQKLKSSAP